MSFVAGGHRVRAPLGAKRKPTTSRLTAPNQEQEFKALRRAVAVRDNVPAAAAAATAAGTAGRATLVVPVLPL